MRLIDADKINFEEVFGGQSDFAKDLRKAAQELIGSQPTAFDMEKVIEELEDYLFEKYCVEGDKKIAEIVEKGGIE